MFKQPKSRMKMAALMLRFQCSDRYIISLSPHLHTPFPSFYPSLISLISVDVKHHVYLLRFPTEANKELLRRKRTPERTVAVPHIPLKTRNYSNNMNSRIKIHHNQNKTTKRVAVKSRMGGVIGSLIPLLQSDNASHISMKWRPCYDAKHTHKNKQKQTNKQTNKHTH